LKANIQAARIHPETNNSNNLCRRGRAIGLKIKMTKSPKRTLKVSLSLLLENRAG